MWVLQLQKLLTLYSNLLTRMQAEARQQKFDESAVGRATKKSIANAKKEREADAQRRQDNTRDWLN